VAGGRSEKLAAVAADGKVYGIDDAEGSVAASGAQNAQLIKEGRVAIEKASVSQLPFSADKFDLVTAVETQYYWPNLVEDMREIVRVLKRPVMWLLRSSHLSVDEHRELFSKAGYVDIQIFEEHDRGWICGTARKPSGPARVAGES
jgi:SAM-dependent methyltransferase